jgi:hypothetical protein
VHSVLLKISQKGSHVAHGSTFGPVIKVTLKMSQSELLHEILCRSAINNFTETSLVVSVVLHVVGHMGITEGLDDRGSVPDGGG